MRPDLSKLSPLELKRLYYEILWQERKLPLKKGPKKKLKRRGGKPR